MTLNKLKKKIIKAYADLNKKLGRSPKMEEIQALGITKDSIKHHFSSLSSLDTIARDQSPNSFMDIKIEDLLTNKAIIDLRKAIKKHKKFIITTAVTGCEVDNNFYQSIKTYSRANDALLLILVASDPAHVHSRGGYGSIDKTLSSEKVVLEDLELNSNVFVSTLKLSAKQINPTTGLGRIGQRDGTFIFASPKQHLNMVATSNIKLPHAVMTTGAITKSNYNTDKYMSERTAYIADADHIMGALILSIENDKEYHYTQIQSKSKDGSFAHMGVRYHADGSITKEKVAALVLGDWHSGSTDPIVKKCTEAMLKKLSPNVVVLHDLFDGDSINHHEEHNKLLKAQKMLNMKPSLKEEIQLVKEDIEWFASKTKEVVVVKSNHDEFLSKHYLAKGKYVDDPANHYFSLDLAKAMIEGRDPLKVGAELLGLSSSNVRWLQRDEDYKIADIQLGAHGDKGPNGSKGSLKNMQGAYGQSVSGHSHTPGILHGAFAVGTSSFLKLNYNEGPSSWLQTHCVVYSDGSRQLLNMINGKWDF